MVKNLPANAGDSGSIPGPEKAFGEENGKPLQFSCLENPMDRGAGWATVHRVEKSRTQLKWLSTCTHNLKYLVFNRKLLNTKYTNRKRRSIL